MRGDARFRMDSVAYKLGEKARLTLYAPGEGEVAVYSPSGALVTSWRTAGEESTEEVVLEDEGVYTVKVRAGGRSAETRFIAVEEVAEKPLLAIVLHDHQAPNYSPDGSIREPWAFTHVWLDEFTPYARGGAYYVQAKLLEKWGTRLTVNLSPSLLAQWVNLLERGAVLNRDGFYESVEADSPRARMVEETLSTFKRLVNGGVVEVLTSFFSHPLAGFIAEYYGWLDLLEDELEAGCEVTSRVFGTSPSGVWLPEMSFSQKLLGILAGAGIRYTVLDGVAHYPEAVGSKQGIFTVYSLGGLGIVFRHTGLSDLWSFKYSSVDDGWTAELDAHDYAFRIAWEALANRARTLAVALDGENWMILPKPKPACPVFLDSLLRLLASLDRGGIVRLSRLQDVFSSVEPTPLLSVPARTWRGGYEKWTSEKVGVQRRIWGTIVEAFEAYSALSNAGVADRGDLFAMMCAVNSDHIWAEFADETFAEEWMGALKRKLDAAISSIKFDGVQDGALIVTNTYGGPIRLKVAWDGEARVITLKPGVNRVRVEGRVVEFSIEGWRRTFRVAKPLILGGAQVV